MNASYYPAVTRKFIVLIYAVFLLGLAGTLAAAQSARADKEKPLASDQEIAAAIEKHLAADPAVSSDKIKVATHKQ